MERGIEGEGERVGGMEGGREGGEWEWERMEGEREGGREGRVGMGEEGRGWKGR